MNIEFRKHQLVVAGLSQQIELLNQRCVEHRQSIDCIKSECEKALAARDQRIGDLTTTLQNARMAAELDNQILAVATKQLEAVEAAAIGSPVEVPPDRQSNALKETLWLRQQFDAIYQVLNGAECSVEPMDRSCALELAVSLVESHKSALDSLNELRRRERAKR